jgi:hypothetical protein
MLVLDTGAQHNWRKAAKAEANAAARQNALLEDIRSNSVSIEDDGGIDTSLLPAQLGKPLASQEVQRRLKLMVPNLIFEVSPHDQTKTGIYIEVDERNLAGSFQKRKVFLCGMETGINPEFSVLHKTKTRVANPELFGKDKPVKEAPWKQVDTFASETRGWRTVLVRLLHLGIIRQNQVDQQFGRNPSRESKKWKERTG